MPVRVDVAAVKRYGYAALAAALAAAARIVLGRFAGYHNPYTAFYVAVLWSAWFGGLGPAILTIGLGGAFTALLTFPPAFLRGIEQGSLVGFEFYLIVSLTCAILMYAERKAERMWEYNARIARERLDQLEREMAQRKQAEEHLRQAQKMESIGLLAGGIAHDFNNLLTGVLGNTSLVLDSLPPGSDAARLLENALQAAERAAQLTAQLLAYAGKGRFVEQDLNLSEVVRESAEEIRPSVDRGIELRLDLSASLPRLRADRSLIRQVISSLLTNAVEAVDGRGGAITIATAQVRFDSEHAPPVPRIGQLGAGDYIVLRVRDTGVGMDETVVHQVFDPFFTTKFMGRGLGLAAVSGIVRSHNGAIAVASEPGMGSVFSVFFPVEQEAGEWRMTA